MKKTLRAFLKGKKFPIKVTDSDFGNDYIEIRSIDGEYAFGFNKNGNSAVITLTAKGSWESYLPKPTMLYGFIRPFAGAADAYMIGFSEDETLDNVRKTLPVHERDKLRRASWLDYQVPA